MKKLTAMLLALTMVAALAAGCAPAGKPAPTTQPTTAPTTAPNEASTEAPTTAPEETTTPVETEPQLSPLAAVIDEIYAAYGEIQLPVATMPVPAERITYFTGLASDEKVADAVVSEAMIGSQAYSLALVQVKDAADAEAVAREMHDGIDTRKWICVEADDLMVSVSGDLVMLVMVDSVFAEDGLTAQALTDAFQTVRGGELDSIIAE